MPKIIAGVKEALLNETKRQIEEVGYEHTTIRSVAAACGLAIGTVYNYFPSKDMLVASLLMEDWTQVILDLKTAPTSDPRAYLHQMYQSLVDFSARHRSLFADPMAMKVFSSAFFQRHVQLREQMALLCAPLCQEKENATFLASFIAEAMLTWTMSGTPFDTLYGAIEKMIIE